MQTTEKKEASRHSEVKGLALLGLSLILLLSLLSFDTEYPEKNWLGLLGWGLSYGATFLCGLCSYFLVIFSAWLGWKFLTDRASFSPKVQVIYFSLFLISCSFLLTLYAELGTALNVI